MTLPFALGSSAIVALDYLLIGHGLAGAVLAHTLAATGARLLVLDVPAPDSASRVAAGLVNPLAGRRAALTWRAEELLPAAAAFYKSVAAETGAKPFWHDYPIWKFFGTADEVAAGLARVGTPFVAGAVPPTDTEALRAPFGGLILSGGGFLQTEPFLDALTAHRRARGEWRAEAFELARLQTGTAAVSGADLAADAVSGLISSADSTSLSSQATPPISTEPLRYTLADGTTISACCVIFCEGAAAEHNPFWRWLPLVPNNGQVLDLEIESAGLPPDVVLNGGAYAVPVPGRAGAYRFGATYDWGTQPPTPTPAGRADLLGRLARFTPRPVCVTAHRAARRPAVRDRRPLVGFHPAEARLVLFNGLGSKGVGLAPGLAAHLAAVLAGTETLWPEVNLARFAALYQTAI